MNDEVRTIMDSNPLTANPNQTVNEVSEFMLKNRVQQLPVVEDGQLLGLVTTFDLWKRYENATTIGEMLVKDVMNSRILKISPKDKVGTAAELFADKRFKTLPVVNIRNELKGTITAFDIIRVAYNNEYPKSILFKEEFAGHRQ